MNFVSILYFPTNEYFGNSADGIGETVRTTFFSGAMCGLFCARKELELAFRLDFLFLFHQGKRKIETNKNQNSLLA